MTKIKGTKRDDLLVGGADNDSIEGLAGNDRLWGLGGDDWLAGGVGNDTLCGGAGNDTLLGGRGSDEYRHSGTALDGDDVVKTGDAGLDRIAFTTPDLYDFDFERDGNDLIVGILDEDTEEFAGTLRVVNHYAGSSIAYVQADFADLNLDYGTNPDMATIYFTPDLKHGIDNADAAEILIGTDGNDIINGNGGYFDYLTGGAGNDTIHGGDGFDNVRGGEGDDKLFGDGGNDVIRGDLGSDLIDGGAGADLVRYDGSSTTSGMLVDLTLGIAQDLLGDDVNSGVDTLQNVENVRGSSYSDHIIGDGTDNFVRAGAGDDQVEGLAGNDFLAGESGNDWIAGGADNDSLDGGAGDDALDGGSGENFMVGGDGNDIITGGDGSDFLSGGSGDDALTGGDGADDFAFDVSEYGIDTVLDFDGFGDLDFLQFNNVGDQNSDSLVDLDDLLMLTAGIFDDSTDVTLSFTTGSSIVFAGAGTGLVDHITDLVDAGGQIAIL